MHQRNVSQQGALAVKKVVYGNDGDVEQVAAQQVANGHVERTQAQGRQGDGQLRQGGGHGHEQAADKTAVPAHGVCQVNRGEGQPQPCEHNHQRR